jgi:hypothetical protein
LQCVFVIALDIDIAIACFAVQKRAEIIKHILFGASRTASHIVAYYFAARSAYLPHRDAVCKRAGFGCFKLIHTCSFFWVLISLAYTLIITQAACVVNNFFNYFSFSFSGPSMAHKFGARGERGVPRYINQQPQHKIRLDNME